jgi:hypothetical protein
MRRACFRFGVLGLALVVACWRGGGASAPTTIANHDPVVEDTLSGGYWCSIESDGYRYGEFPCAIRHEQGRYLLAKLGGSQRFDGEIVPNGEGFTFRGRFFCPYGDCTQAVNGAFVKRRDGSFQGTFAGVNVVVDLAKAPDSAFGGAAYGGDEYGGFGYGGAGYGNALIRPKFPSNRRP